MVARVGEKVAGKGWGVWHGHAHTAVFKMDTKQGPTAQLREVCAVLGGSLDGASLEEKGSRHVYGSVPSLFT